MKSYPLQNAAARPMLDNCNKAQISLALFKMTTIAQDGFARVLNGRSLHVRHFFVTAPNHARSERELTANMQRRKPMLRLSV